MMETIRVTADEQRRIGEAAKKAGKPKQHFCLAAIMEAVEQSERQPEPEPPVPEGCIRLRPFDQPMVDVPHHPTMPASAAQASQFQHEGLWYIAKLNGDIITTWPDHLMGAYLPNPDIEHTLTMAS
jgi:hypothetical protein